MYRIIGADGREYGPVSADQLRQWINEGRVNAQTQVLLEGTTEWKPLSGHAEFADVLGGPPPALAAPQAVPTAALDAVQGPAIGLIVVAILGFLVQLAGLIMNLAGAAIPPPKSVPSEAWVQMFSGGTAIASSIIGLAMSVLVLYGALKMKKLESFGLAMTASIVAMIPCISPCCLVGLPLGIWALVVLNKPEVKSAFH